MRAVGRRVLSGSKFSRRGDPNFLGRTGRPFFLFDRGWAASLAEKIVGPNELSGSLDGELLELGETRRTLKR